MLVDAVDNVAGPGISDSTVLGPFYAGHQRELAHDDSILLREEEGEPLVMSGRVTDPQGQDGRRRADRGLADSSQSAV